MTALHLLDIESTSFSKSRSNNSERRADDCFNKAGLVGWSQPQIVNTVEIWTVSTPSKQLDIVLLEPSGTDMRSCVAWCSILLKYEVTTSTKQIMGREQHLWFQYFLGIPASIYFPLQHLQLHPTSDNSLHFAVRMPLMDATLELCCWMFSGMMQTFQQTQTKLTVYIVSSHC